VTTLINVESQLIGLVAEQVAADSGAISGTVAQELEGLAAVQFQLTKGLTQLASQGLATDPTFQQDLSTLVNNESQLTTLVGKETTSS
jgi:hypothetical protein